MSVSAGVGMNRVESLVLMRTHNDQLGPVRTSLEVAGWPLAPIGSSDY